MIPKIVVVGGRPRNFEQKFFSDPRVEFRLTADANRWRKSPLPAGTELVIFTPFVSHRHSEPLREEARDKGISCRSKLHNTGEIRRTIEEFLRKHPLPEKTVRETGTSEPAPREMPVTESSRQFAHADAEADGQTSTTSVPEILLSLMESANSSIAGAKALKKYIEGLETRLEAAEQAVAKLAGIERELNELKTRKAEMYSEMQRLRQELGSKDRELERLRQVETVFQSIQAGLASLNTVKA